MTCLANRVWFGHSSHLGKLAQAGGQDPWIWDPMNLGAAKAVTSFFFLPGGFTPVAFLRRAGARRLHMAEVGWAQAPLATGSRTSLGNQSAPRLSLDGQPFFANGTLPLFPRHTSPCKTLRTFLMPRSTCGEWWRPGFGKCIPAGN